MRKTSELQRVPVIVCAGNMNPVTLQAARDFGVDALHDKSSNFQDIVKLTRTYL